MKIFKSALQNPVQIPKLIRPTTSTQTFFDS
jgi:hypothetical protein